MALSLRRIVGYVLLFTLWGIPPRQALAIQTTSVVLLDESPGWQPARSDLNWSAEDDGGNRLVSMMLGGTVGAGVGFLVALSTSLSNEAQDDSHALEFVLGGAALGVIAALMLTEPLPEDEDVLQLGFAFRPYIPAQGGVGVALGF